MRCIEIFLYKQYFYVPKTELHFYEGRRIERMVVMGTNMKGVIKNMDQGTQGEGEVNDMNRMAVMGPIMNMDQGTQGEGEE